MPRDIKAESEPRLWFVVGSTGHLCTMIFLWCENCARCFTAKDAIPKIRARMCNLLANQPIATDFTLLERSSSGLEHVLVITDVLTSTHWQFLQRIKRPKRLQEYL